MGRAAHGQAQVTPPDTAWSTKLTPARLTVLVVSTRRAPLSDRAVLLVNEPPLMLMVPRPDCTQVNAAISPAL